jgi:hypothetical protein
VLHINGRVPVTMEEFDMNPPPPPLIEYSFGDDVVMLCSVFAHSLTYSCVPKHKTKYIQSSTVMIVHNALHI